jgi:hypothetical protein
MTPAQVYELTADEYDALQRFAMREIRATARANRRRRG